MAATNCLQLLNLYAQSTRGSSYTVHNKKLFKDDDDGDVRL